MSEVAAGSDWTKRIPYIRYIAAATPAFRRYGIFSKKIQNPISPKNQFGYSRCNYKGLEKNRTEKVAFIDLNAEFCRQLLLITPYE